MDNQTLPTKIKCLSALDLPPIHTQPSAERLLSILQSLAIQPSTFEKGENGVDSEQVREGTGGDAAGYLRYFTSTVKSPLAWIEDEGVREQIWDLASARMSERAGRTAMPSMTRQFTIPRASPDADDDTTRGSSALSITLLEPSLTGDNLGHKTWCASYILALRLRHLQQLLSGPESSQRLRVLELGAGTGLLGIAFASIFPHSEIDLTDLPTIVTNLAQNVAANRALLQLVGSTASAFALDWADAVPKPNSERYDIVLVADPLYSPDHPPLLVGAVSANLRRSGEARLVIGLPLRDTYAAEIKDLKFRLGKIALGLMEQGEEYGVDDWQEQKGEKVEVKCWWGVWRWRRI